MKKATVTFRIPVALKRKLEARAKARGLTLTSQLIVALERELEWNVGPRRVAQRVIFGDSSGLP